MRRGTGWEICHQQQLGGESRCQERRLGFQNRKGFVMEKKEVTLDAAKLSLEKLMSPLASKAHEVQETQLKLVENW